MSFMLLFFDTFQVNDTNVPLYFKFSTIPTKTNLTSDKYMSLDNWMYIYDELNPLLASADDPSSYKKNKSFDLDSGRLTVKTRWIKVSDVSEKGNHILKMLNLSSTSVGKYYLKIDVKLSSYLERIVAELEQKSKCLEGKNKPKQPKQDGHNSGKHKKSSNRKISDMLPKIEKENHDSSTLSIDAAVACNGFDYSTAEDLSNHEEYIPEPVPSFSAESTPTYKPGFGQTDRKPIPSEYSPVCLRAEQSIEESTGYEPTTATTTSTPTYYPEKNLSQIEINQIKSEYSPTCMTEDKTEGIVYKPTTKLNKSAESDKSDKLTDIKNQSRELFGSSDENCDDDPEKPAKVSSSSHKSKRKKDSSRDKKSSKDKSNSKKKKLHDVQSSQDTSMDVCDITIRYGNLILFIFKDRFIRNDYFFLNRNLMGADINDILDTYTEHEQYLTHLYDKHITRVVRFSI